MMMMKPILFLVSRGLLEHKPRMGRSIWEYLWFIDKVTKEEPVGDGKFNGLVLGGKPVTASQVANDLKEHINTARVNIQSLENGGYIVRKKHPDSSWSVIVTNSKKWFCNRPTPSQKTVTPLTESCDHNKERQDRYKTERYIQPEPKTGSVSLSSTPRQSKTIKTPLPAKFQISENVRKWASAKGHTRLEERLEHFIGYAKANGKKYVDWDQALQNAIRDDWAKLNGNTKPIPIRGSSAAVPAPLPLFAPAEPMPRPNPDVVRLTAYKPGGVAR